MKLETFLTETDIFTNTDIKLSKTTIGIISSMIPIIKEGDSLFKTAKFEIHSSKCTPRGENYNVIPTQVRQHIENNMPDKKCAKIVFTVRERNYQLYLIHENLSHNELKRRLRLIYVWLYLASHYANNKCSKNTNIYMYFTELVKTLPQSNGSIIDEMHANTAFTTSCLPETSIYLFRQEEWFKVFIHESFHNLGLDFSGIENISASKILDIFPVKSDVNLFETYCEMWAEIINVLFSAIYCEKSMPLIVAENNDDILDNFDKKIRLERRFSLFQCAKVLHFYGMEYKDLYEKTVGSIKKRTYNYKENTNVLSYYILKSIFMFYFNDFMEWCEKFSRGSLQFNENVIDQYCEFIQLRYKRGDFLQAIDSIEKWIDENEDGGVVWRTLRMTVTDV
uniref:Uncharacterized protein n=1 Tax=viral metagenome TaxID=1070528 RepID=A0A6C0DQZ0_9ZZZZ